MLNLKIGTISGKSFLREMTSDERAWLLSQLTHRKSRFRWIAANELGKYQVKESIEPLILALQDNHWLVRLHAAKALGKIGDKRALESLKQSLQDNCPYVRRRVIVSLGKIGDESVIHLLLRIILIDESMLFYISNALNNFMGQYAAYALINASRGSERKWKSNPYLNLLGRFTPILAFVLRFSDDNLRSFIVIKMLGACGDARASKVLEWFATYSRNRNFRKFAYQALGQIQCRAFEKYLP